MTTKNAYREALQMCGYRPTQWVLTENTRTREWTSHFLLGGTLVEEEKVRSTRSTWVVHNGNATLPGFSSPGKALEKAGFPAEALKINKKLDGC